MNLCLLALAGTLAGVPLRVAVAPVGGDAPENLRSQATASIEQALKNLNGAEAVSLSAWEKLFGSQAAEALNSCQSDACWVQQTARIQRDRVLLGELVVTGGALQLRLRLLGTSSTAAPLVRLLKDTSANSEGVNQAAATGVFEIFPQLAKNSLALVYVQGPEGTDIYIAGKKQGSLQPNPLLEQAQLKLSLPPGKHALEGRLPGHFNYQAEVTAQLGEPVYHVLELSKNRSQGPLWLGGGAVVAAGAAAVLGILAQDKADSWKTGCPGACGPGYTADQYRSDNDFINAASGGANALYGVAGAAALGALFWYIFDTGSDVEQNP